MNQSRSQAEKKRRWRPPNYIAIEGPIGVGKSSLARRLSELFDAKLILEEAEKNDFLPDFYQNSQKFALHTQLNFLIRRTRQLSMLKQQDLFNQRYIADYTLEKNQLFAQFTLDRAEYQLYQQIQNLLQRDQVEPDLVIYLQAPVDVLIDRIMTRGVEYERNISTQYLQQVCQVYVEFFHRYDASPLLIVNAEGIDLVNDDMMLYELADKIIATKFGHHYYNPVPQNELPLA